MTQKDYNDVEEKCKDIYGVKSDFFIEDGITWKVDFTSTNGVNILNNGTPFVCAYNTLLPYQHIRIKAFLIREWIYRKDIDSQIIKTNEQSKGSVKG